MPARRMAQRVLGPLERFLHVEAASGIVLLVAALVALIWANSRWAPLYEHLWHTPITLGIGTYTFTESLHFWINDGLMVIFFFVVGLEIRREIHSGELSDLKRATLPIAAALGGMAAPALIYLSLNPAGLARQGWGVPTATDIAFAIGVLALLGKRVPAALRVLLLALAIIDDIGAIVVIAIFYSSGISVAGLALAAGGVVGVVLLQRFGVRQPLAYVLPGAILWAGMLRAGVHPTIAGVVLGLLTPARAWFGERGFLVVGQHAIEEFRKHSERDDHRADDLLPALAQLREARREALPPVVQIQAALHPWVAYGIMPLFALANAGVSLGGVALDDPTSTRILLGITAGLVVGKPIGILIVSFITIRVGVAALPRGVTWGGILLVGCVAGIGFTMAIFIANLAFPGAAAVVGVAKLAVLLASLVAAILGLIVGRVILAPSPVADAAATVDEAEASTEQ